MRCVDAIEIDVPVEIVWKITQNPERRKDWDFRVTESKQLSGGKIGKNTKCSVSGSFGLRYYLEYRYVLYQEGFKTAIKVIDCKGFPISGGGGGWTYEKLDENSCRFHLNFILNLKKMPFSRQIDEIILTPIFRWMSRKSLKKLKLIAEKEWEVHRASKII